MKGRSWLDDEPRASAYVAQAARLLRSGVKRPLALFVTVALLATALGCALSLTRRGYAPRYVMRVVETDRDPSGTPRPRRQLAEYVQQAVFTSEPLLELIRRYGLYPSLARKNPRAALDSFREDIHVDVYQNYFVEERSVGAAPRSARLVVSYHGPDRDVAIGVTRDLGALIRTHELQTRRDQSERAADLAKSEVDAVNQAVLSRVREIAARRSAIDRAPGAAPELQVELVSLLGSLDALERQQEVSERREAALALGAALEGQGLGMSFEVVEDASLATDTERRAGSLALAGVSFLVGLPLTAMAVGAFDPKKGRA